MHREWVMSIISEIQSNPEILAMTNPELQEEIARVIERAIKVAKSNDQKLWRALASLTFKEKAALESDIFNAIRGLSIIDKITNDPDITEIMINGYRDIFIEKNGKLERYSESFASKEKLLNVINKFVSEADRSVNMSNPIVDTRLADGSRVNVVLPPVAINGPIVTIRRFHEKTMSMRQLVDLQTISAEAVTMLEHLVKAKFNIFICGGTGSGKTTFLNALSHFIPRHERLITIEDSAELQLSGIENLVKLEATSNNFSAMRKITISDLIRTSLRMRPERIIVGEVRGAEALDMLQAMNTGHDGSLSTGHANSTQDMFSRLETMVMSGASGLPLSAVQQQIASALDIIVYIARLRDFSRKVMEISEVIDYRDGRIKLNPLFLYKIDHELSNREKVVGKLTRTDNKFISIGKFINLGMDIHDL